MPEPEPYELNSRVQLSLPPVVLAATLLLAPSAQAEPPPMIPGADAAVARAESILGSDRFGPYGCEALVAYACNASQATGAGVWAIGNDTRALPGVPSSLEVSR